MLKKIILTIALTNLILFTGCSQRTVTVIDNNHIPANLLTPLAHPIAVRPYTVNMLLIIISQYEAVVDKANDRFAEIIFIQDNNPLTGE